MENRVREFPVRIIGNCKEGIQTINQEPAQFEANVENLLEFLKFNFPYASYPKGRVIVAVARLDKDGNYTEATIYKTGFMGTVDNEKSSKVFLLRDEDHRVM